MATIQIINVDVPNSGLGDTLRASQVKANSNFASLNANKVEAVPGFDLSENNFTDAEKAKLATIEEGAEVNVQANWNQTDPDADDFILNKPSIGSTTVFIFDGIIGTTVGFSVGQLSFILPSGAVAKDVYLAHTKQYKTTANNTSLVNRWSQTGDTVTITKSPVLNNYIYIEYE